MPGWVRDPTWEFIGVVVSLIAIGVAFWIYARQKNKKLLKYQIVSYVSLLNVHEEARGRLKVLFDRREVKDVRLAVIKFRNGGNAPITKGDFDQPLRIIFGASGEVVPLTDEDIIEKIPKDLAVEIKKPNGNATNVVEFEKLLMNRKDSFTVKAIAIDCPGELRVLARIIGGDVVKEKGDNFFIKVVISVFFIFGTMFTSMLMGTLLERYGLLSSYIISSGIGYIMIFGMVVIIAVMFLALSLPGRR